jgi:hypothetical protein
LAAFDVISYDSDFIEVEAKQTSVVGINSIELQILDGDPQGGGNIIDRIDFMSPPGTIGHKFENLDPDTQYWLNYVPDINDDYQDNLIPETHIIQSTDYQRGEIVTAQADNDSGNLKIDFTLLDTVHVNEIEII